MKTSWLMVAGVACSSTAWKTRVPVDIEKVTKEGLVDLHEPRTRGVGPREARGALMGRS